MSKEEQGATRGKGRLLLVLVLPFLLLLGGAVAAYYAGLLPLRDPFAATAATDPALDVEPPLNASDIVFVQLPDLLVNLSVVGPRLRFLKFAVALEVVGQKEAETVQRFVPRITDNVHVYLRALQPEELEGAEGVYRIKRDLLQRINQVVRPAQVRDVLVKEMLVQ